MKYHDGSLIMVGDHVSLGQDEGVVVLSVETDEYSTDYPKAEWAYLAHGIMIHFSMLGLVHVTEYDPELSFLGRAVAGTSR